MITDIAAIRAANDAAIQALEARQASRHHVPKIATGSPLERDQDHEGDHHPHRAPTRS